MVNLGVYCKASETPAQCNKGMHGVSFSDVIAASEGWDSRVGSTCQGCSRQLVRSDMAVSTADPRPKSLLYQAVSVCVRSGLS